jgi:hypothetical protein
MDRPQPRIESADVVAGGVLITFDDDRCALYPAALLLTVFSDAIAIEDSDSIEPLP